MILRTERLCLRKAEPSDAEALFGIFGDPEAMRYWSSGPDATVAQTAARIARYVGHGPPLTCFAVERAGEVIGTAGTFDKGEIGYVLRRDQWGQGIAREALTALIPYLFDVLDVPALRAEVDPRNLGSVVVLSKLGFLVCGFSRDYYLLEGTPCDSVYMRLPRPE